MSFAIVPRADTGNKTEQVDERTNQSIANFAASLSTAATIFGVQIAIFLVLSGNWKLRRSKKGLTEQPSERQSLFQRIYYYKTAFVPKAKRIGAPVTAIESFKTVFTISDRELIRIAGVDGFLFVEYLQLLLRIFLPMAFVVLPILLPINRIGDVKDVSGLDAFAWPNVGVPQKVRRLWAHVILAVCVVIWVCFNFYLALRKFVRLRQSTLTMPEHRIRASATTILVQSIPRKWLTMTALDALYDVFPGGIKDIWINRNYDDLQDKVDKRTKYARALESAETNLIILCNKKHQEAEAVKAKAEGKKKKTRKEKKREAATENEAIQQETRDQGTDAGNPHQIERQLQSVLEESSSSGSSSSSSSRSSSPSRKKGLFPIPLIGPGMHAVTDGFRDVGQGVVGLNKKMIGGFKGAFGGQKSGRQDRNERDLSHGYPQLDGNLEDRDIEQPISSPNSPTFAQRGASSDTYSPLAAPDMDKYGLEDSTTAANVRRVDVTEDKPDKAKKSSLWQKLQTSPMNPLRGFNKMGDDFLSPQPLRKEGDELMEVKEVEKIKYDYAGVYNDALAEDGDDALWRTYIKPKDRETMRLPLFDWSWWPSLPLIGKKVDTIYYCRKELAKLNTEIDEDQAHPERFPLMNSAFIQFNHQVAAHMACQSLSHHVPRQMNPRTVEVNPNHVLWDNLTMKWWERYLRLFGVIVLIVGLIIFWGIPVSFTGALSQVSTLTDELPWLAFLEKLPKWAISFVQGVLPPLFLAILFVVLPIVLRFLAGLTGTTTSGERELLVQNFYFAFVFIQLFLVVSLSTGLTVTIQNLANNPTDIPQELAKNLPKAANYFFSYMILQALSISSGTLLQIGAVAMILIFGFFDTTPRQKVSRVLNRSGINWGTMIPVYTNFGAIGIIYSIISPLIIVMMLITFSLFWFTYRYQMIYVSYAKAETNGLIFPKAVNQLFTGIYFLELCLIGLFFLQSREACLPHAIIMIVTLGFTVLYQYVLNRAFGPLFNYLPITFEDEAVQRDEEFQRAQMARWSKEEGGEHSSLLAEEIANRTAEERELAHLANLTAEERELAHLEEQDRLDAQEQYRPNSQRYLSDRSTENYELKELRRKQSSINEHSGPEHQRRRNNWAVKSETSRSRSRSQSHTTTPKAHRKHRKDPFDTLADTLKKGLNDVSRPVRDIEAQVLPSGNLFDEVDDELMDIEPSARQKLIKRSFQHPATRTIQPAVWVPHDDLGIARDEIQRTSAFSQRIWITSVNARLSANGKVMYKGLPPDRDPFENMDI